VKCTQCLIDSEDGLARIGGAGAMPLVIGGTIGVVLVALMLDLFYLALGKFTTPRGLK
jgi:osmoprotectant transport system permease protein